MQHDELIDVERRDELLLDGRRREKARLVRRVDDRQRVVVEGDHRRGEAALAGRLAGHADDELVAGVHAVEGAQGHARGRRGRPRMVMTSITA